MNCKWSPFQPCAGEVETPNSLQNQAFPLVEMGGLEPPTPYMRNDSRSEEPSSKRTRKSRKAS
jgi:hypothetical protein